MRYKYTAISRTWVVGKSVRDNPEIEGHCEWF